jgi:hypothetical protein
VRAGNVVGPLFRQAFQEIASHSVADDDRKSDSREVNIDRGRLR